MSKGKIYWTVKETQIYAEELGVTLTPPTIHRYCKEFKLGHQVGGNAEQRWGKWMVHIDKFKNFLRGDFNAKRNSSSTEQEKI